MMVIPDPIGLLHKKKINKTNGLQKTYKVLGKHLWTEAHFVRCNVKEREETHTYFLDSDSCFNDSNTICVL